MAGASGGGRGADASFHDTGPAGPRSNGPPGRDRETAAARYSPRMTREPDGAPIGEAMGWVARITAIGLTMFVPGVAGTWLDARLGTKFLGPLGLVAGFVVAIATLARLRGGRGRRVP